MTRIHLIALVAIAVVFVVGCGGGDGGNNGKQNSRGSAKGNVSGSTSPSKQEFANNADKICLDVSQRVADLNTIKPRSLSDLARFIDRLKAAVKDGINRLTALERPKGDAGTKARQFTDALDREYQRQVLPPLNQLQRAVAKRDRNALEAASKKLRAIQNQTSTRLATELGAAKCATG